MHISSRICDGHRAGERGSSRYLTRWVMRAVVRSGIEADRQSLANDKEVRSHPFYSRAVLAAQ